MADRVRVVVAHFVTNRLALPSNCVLNCQHKFIFCAARRRKFTYLPSWSTLLYYGRGMRYVPFLYCYYCTSTLLYVRYEL
jgi:hypothetical protein